MTTRTQWRRWALACMAVMTSLCVGIETASLTPRREPSSWWVVAGLCVTSALLVVVSASLEEDR